MDVDRPRRRVEVVRHRVRQPRPSIAASPSTMRTRRLPLACRHDSTSAVSSRCPRTCVTNRPHSPCSATERVLPYLTPVSGSGNGASRRGQHRVTPRRRRRRRRTRGRRPEREVLERAGDAIDEAHPPARQEHVGRQGPLVGDEAGDPHEHEWRAEATSGSAACRRRRRPVAEEDAEQRHEHRAEQEEEVLVVAHRRRPRPGRYRWRRRRRRARDGRAREDVLDAHRGRVDVGEGLVGLAREQREQDGVPTTAPAESPSIAGGDAGGGRVDEPGREHEQAPRA